MDDKLKQFIILNQKGIAFIPILLWSAILLIGGIVGQDVVRRGYITVENLYTKKVLYSNIDFAPSPTLAPSSIPIPTPEPTRVPTTTNNLQGTNNQAQVTEDGSRTGRIVKYKEFCKGGQEISVYENELITRKALSDGKTYSMTKDDWDCSDKSFASNNKTQLSNNTLQQNYTSSEYKAARIKDLKAALKIDDDQITFYKNELDKTLKLYNELASLYQSGSIPKSDFESKGKGLVDADSFIRSTLLELAKNGDTLINLIRRFENGENISPAEEKAILGY